MKKLEKYKIAPQAKFVKFKVKHFVEMVRNIGQWLILIQYIKI